MIGNVLVFGSINTDLVTYVEVLPSPGETVSGGRYLSFPGGKGANQAVAAARAGAAVEMFGCIGDDGLGRECLLSLEEAKVDTKGIFIKQGVHSGIAQIIVDQAGENMIAVAPGANARFRPDDVTLPENTPPGTAVALFQNEIPQSTTESLIRRCKSREMLVVWNVAPACRERPAHQTIQAVDFLVCNRLELVALVGDGDDETLAGELRSWGAASVIVTLGESGSLVVTADGTHRQGAFPVDVLDTVGTGDCFCGVFAASLSLGTAVKESLRRASAAAALSATVRGAQTSMPSAGDIDRLLSVTEGHT